MSKSVEDIISNMILVSGPSKGGKSKWAEHLLKDHIHVTYIATAPVIEEPDWIERIQAHKRRRPPHWNIVESPKNLAETINIIKDSESILIDSLGFFVYNNLDQNNNEWKSSELNLIKVLKQLRNYTVIVIEETGWSPVPETYSGNIFRDRLGSLAQSLELISSCSWLVVQGRAINLHQISTKVP